MNPSEVLETLIEVTDVTKCFKETCAVNNLSLSIYKGEYTALLGPNGAGKTTLVEMIEGIQKPDSGEITILGKPWKNNERFLQSQIGIALQETRFNDKLSVEETLTLFCGFYKKGKDRALEIMKIIDLGNKAKTFAVNLSGGQRQKLALGIALINKPQILLLDEPTTGLDPHARKEIWEILLQLKKEGTSMILTTHYMEEAEKLCKRILIMNKGTIIAKGNLDELLADHEACEIIEFELNQKTSLDFKKEIPGFLEIGWEPDQTRGCLKVSNIVEALPPFLKFIKRENLTLKELQSRKMTLNDLFVEMTGRQLHE